MTMPNAGFQPGGQPQGRPYVQAGMGYDQATQLANGQQPAQQQQAPQYQTQLGQPVQPNLPPGLLGAESVSPLSLVPPNVQQQPGIAQQRQAPAQYGLQQQYQYNNPQQVQQQQVDPLQQPIYDPRLPAELQGKSVAQLAQMNHGLRQLHMQSMQQQPLTQPQAGSSPQTTAQPQQQGQQQTTAQQPASQFNWQRPDESIGRIVEEKIGSLETKIGAMLQPMVATGQMTQAQTARNIVAAEIPNFAQLEPQILYRLQGLSPTDLASLETWRVAARLAIGDTALAAYQQQRQGGQQAPQGTPQYQGAYPAQQVQQGGQPVPNINGFQSFFSEQPNQGGPGPIGNHQLTPAQRNAAMAMNMSEADYIAWGAGVPSGARR